MRSQPTRESGFQSTPSVWRETVDIRPLRGKTPISIHSLRVEGDGATRAREPTDDAISIHSLRVEGD